MSDAFASAAARHWRDAQLLFDCDRFDNAAYLAGYAVECSLKVLLQVGTLAPRAFGHELDRLSGDALFLACLLTPSVRRYHIPKTLELQEVLHTHNCIM